MLNNRISLLRTLIHILALLPLVILVWDFTQGRLTVNPIQEIQLRTGKYALIFLVLTLSCTPLNILFGFKSVLRLRRALGLYSFMYASLHLFNFIVLDYGFNLDLMLSDISGKRFVFAGLAAFLILSLLAATSLRSSVSRLGRNWHRLHWLVYVAAILSVTHFLWQVKADIREPLIYGILVALLLVIRIPYIKNVINNTRLHLTLV